MFCACEIYVNTQPVSNILLYIFCVYYLYKVGLLAAYCDIMTRFYIKFTSFYTLIAMHA